MTDTRTTFANRHVDGNWIYTGHVTYSCCLDDGTRATLVLPEDWLALVARVAALEAKVQTQPPA